ncbi:MAG: hypothetical protein GY903_00965 [Fuerstiella sp.]|nr:hypothetical protein [Fuerstiella sp.]MCP4853048.1 hypothetical protein [Fuerstiella sp.]
MTEDSFESRIDLFNSSVEELLNICRIIRDGGGNDNDTLRELEEAIEAVELHYEDDDPRSIGWVGDDGLP